ncbi:ribosome maturation factor RimM [Desulfotomaculum sp. 1211_IL3151]|uniref:ribosome maturation factor RimM n=1 Tax=Desulfotomaculum sp. 1211_IL3151 TaxID=3084055 RepID=UPI002FD90A35
MSQDYIKVGEIVNTQGVKGEVRVIPTTDFPERFVKNSKVSVLLRDQRKDYTIERAWEHKQFIIIKFVEISDMTEAEKLKGGLLQITPEELIPLPEGNYYIFQIIGMRVYDQSNQELGNITQVLQTRANDVYVVKNDQGKEILIPAIKSVVKSIDMNSGKMEVVLPDGLI